ncbi:MAG TPA: HD domain-containing phosphohydrolase [Gemmatimonadales bacterium]|nr:HD domain-containing phosphohydrolase [Gemmatimonadales bacterium]
MAISSEAGGPGRTGPQASCPPNAAPKEREHPGELLRRGTACDVEGRMAEARALYETAIAAARAADDKAVLVEALRRLGVLHHRSSETKRATELCESSYALAVDAGADRLAAEALNALACFALDTGELEQAEVRFQRALEVEALDDAIRGRIEQNLGVLANIRGRLDEALEHYRRSLAASERAGSTRDVAFAFHNLGMVSADQQRWDDADRYLRESLQRARAVNDTHLRGLCLLNHTEVHLARQRYEDARASAEGALAIFDELGAQLDKADAYKMLGVVFRETGRPALAEARLRTAIELAIQTGGVLSEAEATRELALLYQSLSRNQEALTLLNAARRLFGRLDARVDLVDVAAKVTELEGTYLAVVRNWGQSIESADSYTYGHCERVAAYGQRVAQAIGLDAASETTIRMGAYLHDLGKVRVPHEILNKPGRLTDEEFAIMKLHPVWGVELVAAIEFPWDIKPIIRSHHEKYDGSGYPDRLLGDEIPLSAQIICAVDVYDALTTTRSYRGALSNDDALARMDACSHWWQPDVYRSFRKAFA